MLEYIHTILKVSSVISCVILLTASYMFISKPVLKYLLAVHDGLVVDNDIPKAVRVHFDESISEFGRDPIENKLTFSTFVTVGLLSVIISVIPIYNIFAMIAFVPSSVRMYRKALKYCESSCDTLDHYKEKE